MMVVIAGVGLPADHLAEALADYALKKQSEHGQRRRRQRGGVIEPFATYPWHLASERILSADGHFEAGFLPDTELEPLTEWASKHQIHPRKARRWAADGKLRTARKTGKVWFVSIAEQPHEKDEHHGKQD